MAPGIKQSLQQKGIRLTRQRQILLDLIDQSARHLDAESLFHLAKEKDPKINRVTVYRTLKMLKAGGLVDELDLMHFNGEQHYYETRMKQEHAHVVCLRCGKVEEFFWRTAAEIAPAGRVELWISGFGCSDGNRWILRELPGGPGARDDDLRAETPCRAAPRRITRSGSHASPILRCIPF
jgi:Fe2+ or Zn2+ uptake regulation protein